MLTLGFSLWKLILVFPGILKELSKHLRSGVNKETICLGRNKFPLRANTFAKLSHAVSTFFPAFWGPIHLLKCWDFFSGNNFQQGISTTSEIPFVLFTFLVQCQNTVFPFLSLHNKSPATQRCTVFLSTPGLPSGWWSLQTALGPPGGLVPGKEQGLQRQSEKPGLEFCCCLMWWT